MSAEAPWWSGAILAPVLLALLWAFRKFFDGICELMRSYLAGQTTERIKERETLAAALSNTQERFIALLISERDAARASSTKQMEIWGGVMEHHTKASEDVYRQNGEILKRIEETLNLLHRNAGGPDATGRGNG